MIKITDKPKGKEEEEKSELIEMLKAPKEIRTIALFGDVDEEKASDLCMGLLMLTDYS